MSLLLYYHQKIMKNYQKFSEKDLKGMNIKHRVKVQIQQITKDIFQNFNLFKSERWCKKI